MFTIQTPCSISSAPLNDRYKSEKSKDHFHTIPINSVSIYPSIYQTPQRKNKEIGKQNKNEKSTYTTSTPVPNCHDILCLLDLLSFMLQDHEYITNNKLTNHSYKVLVQKTYNKLPNLTQIQVSQPKHIQCTVICSN